MVEKKKSTGRKQLSQDAYNDYVKSCCDRGVLPCSREDFDKDAATSGDAPGDDQWMFDLAAEYESRGNGLYGPITFTAQQLPNFVKAVAARIESAAAPAASTPAAPEEVEFPHDYRKWDLKPEAHVRPPFAAPAGQHEAWTAATEKVSNALALAMTLCDAVPTRAHDLAEDESLRHLGKLVNCDVGTGQHGYAVIRDAKAAFAEVLASGFREGRNTNDTSSVNSAASTTGAAQTVDQVRNQALEEAAKTAEATRVAQVQYGLSIFQDGDGTRDDIATAIRALKSRPTPTHSSEAGE